MEAALLVDDRTMASGAHLKELLPLTEHSILGTQSFICSTFHPGTILDAVVVQGKRSINAIYRCGAVSASLADRACYWTPPRTRKRNPDSSGADSGGPFGNGGMITKAYAEAR